LRNIVGKTFTLTKSNATKNKNVDLAIHQNKILIGLDDIFFTANSNNKFPSQIAGIIYTRNIVNGQKITPCNTAAILGTKANGRALARDNFHTEKIRSRLTILQTSSCGPDTKRGRKNNTLTNPTVRAVSVM